MAKTGDAVAGDQRGRHVVLRGERVARAEDDFGAAGLEREHQVRRLRRDVEAGGDAQALQRLLALEMLLDQPDDRHFARRPLDAVDALFGQAEVLDVVLNRG